MEERVEDPQFSPDFSNGLGDSMRVVMLERVRARIETALSSCAPGHEREAVLAVLAEVEREVGG